MPILWAFASMKSLKFLPFFFLLLTQASHAELDERLFNLTLEDLLNIKVSGSTFSGETLNTTPASVNVFTQRDIRRLGLQYVHELANLVPGFQSKRQSDGAALYSISARGRQVGPATRSVKIIINGQPIGSGYVESSTGTLFLIPLENVSKIEFIRGPGSVVFGSGALLASINIETYQDDNASKISMGNWSHVGNHLNYSQGGYYASINYSTDSGDDYKLLDPDTGQFLNANDPIDQSHVYLAKKTGQHHFFLQHHYIATNGFYTVDRVNENFTRENLKYSILSSSHLLMSDTYFDLTLHTTINNRIANFSIQLSPAGALSGLNDGNSDEPILVRATTKSEQYETRLIADWLMQEAHLTVGGEFQYSKPVEALAFSNFNLIDITQGLFPVRYYANDPDPTPFIGAHENQTLALFSEYQYQINHHINTTFSLRYDYAKNTGSEEILPRLAFVYEFVDDNYVKAVYSEAFRNPGALELHLINNGGLLGNKNLAAEKAKTAEIILISSSSFGIFDIAYYYNEIENAIQQVALSTGERKFDNTASDSNDGIELEYRHIFHDSYQLNLTYYRQNSVLNESFRLSENGGSLYFLWHEKKFSGGFNSVYQSSSESLFGPNRVTLPSTWLHTINLNYQHNTQLSSQLLVNNITNKQTMSPASSALLEKGIPSRGRQVIYSIRLGF